MSKLTDFERLKFLREAGMLLGFSEGKPFDKASVKLQLASFELYGMGHVKEMLDHLMMVHKTGSEFTPTDLFVIQIFKDSGVLSAFIALYEYEEKIGE